VRTSTAELLAGWRAAERAFANIEPGSSDEVELTYARDDARRPYRDRFDQLTVTAQFDSGQALPQHREASHIRLDETGS
jgi:hypothetical protein